MPVGKWGALQWLRFTKETTYGVYNSGASDTSPAVASVVQWIRLTDGNAFKMEPAPFIQKVRTADGRNKPAYNIAQRMGLRGTLNLNVPPDQIVMLLPALTTFTGSDGDTMTSWTVDHFDGFTATPKRNLGVVFESGMFESDDSKDFCTLNLSMIGKKQDPTFTTFAEPALSKFSTIRPYCHQDSAGLVLAPGVVTGYKKLQVSIKNRVFAPFNESAYISEPAYRGRDVQWMISKLNLNDTQKAAFEAQSLIATCAVQFSQASPAHSILFDFKSANYISARSIDRGFDVSQYEDLTFDPNVDATAGTDMSITVS